MTPQAQTRSDAAANAQRRGAASAPRKLRRKGPLTRKTATLDVAPAAPVTLRYVSDATPGIRRERRGKNFCYRLPDGSVLRDKAVIARIRKLAIPPAYTDVWICPQADGHLQATGRDARGRKQYRYHAEWTAQRSADKFAHLAEFGEVLPRIRQRVTRDLAKSPEVLSRTLILATLVRLLDTTFLRVGNEEYARQNDSYGLTTLRNRHVVGAHADTLRLRFRGKHGVQHEVSLHDARVTRVVRRCKQLPGQTLFQYEEDGAVRGISSDDVNDYISDAAGARFTAKEFRSWHGTVAALALICAAPDEVPRSAEIVRQVARRLGNTEAVCRKAYIHPEVLSLCQDACAGRSQPTFDTKGGPDGLRAEERRLLTLLRLSQS
ncbi:MAG: DNA topoisomerase IB [Moraxellaceae bacterium]|nr:DNA topoisomerase IB [Moraxellaceae bacterium]